MKTTSLGKIYRRSGGKCWICGLEVPKNPKLEALSPTRDHQVPLAMKRLYHEHDYPLRNTSLAHKHCNMVKGSKLKESLDIQELKAEIISLLQENAKWR